MKFLYWLTLTSVAVIIVNLSLVNTEKKAFSADQSTLSAQSSQQGFSALERCTNQINNKPRAAIALCLREKLKKQEESLATLHKSIEHSYLQLNSSGTKAAVDALAAAKKAFVQFRASECQRVGASAFGGSGAGDFQLACQVDVTHWYINWLKNHQ